MVPASALGLDGSPPPSETVKVGIAGLGGRDRWILFDEKAMRNGVNHCLDNYHAERPHQGLDNELIAPLKEPPAMNSNIEFNERVGG